MKTKKSKKRKRNNPPLTKELEINHEKGHKLQPVLYNSRFGKNENDFVIPNILFCPKCNLFFKVELKNMKGFP